MIERGRPAPPESESDARRVLAGAVDVAKEELGPRLAAAFTLGSLAHGGFAPLVSDVDVALVVERSDDDAVARAIERIGGAVRERHPTSALARRLSVFWADWDGVRRGAAGLGRLPELDRLDLLDAGSLLYGEDRRARATRPSRDDLVREAAEFALRKFDAAYLASLRDPTGLVAAGPRTVTKAVLFPVRFRYTLHTGRIGRNDDASRWHRGPGQHLVAAAMRWRVEGIDDLDEAARLLERELSGLYRRFASEYAAALSAMGRDEPAALLRARWPTSG
ncbi:hypothetical protein [Cumulibacter manganitolerans]|uniref:hypothetical protein n=1 Tax=Cumulibacter manganitolerans TaxID=1884992 RepID=UPI0012949D5B|nr:hypothetical protein [Cumulibacter manganitolerans]